MTLRYGLGEIQIICANPNAAAALKNAIDQTRVFIMKRAGNEPVIVNGVHVKDDKGNPKYQRTIEEYDASRQYGITIRINYGQLEKTDLNDFSDQSLTALRNAIAPLVSSPVPTYVQPSTMPTAPNPAVNNAPSVDDIIRTVQLSLNQAHLSDYTKASLKQDKRIITVTFDG